MTSIRARSVSFAFFAACAATFGLDIVAEAVTLVAAWLLAAARVSTMCLVCAMITQFLAVIWSRDASPCVIVVCSSGG